MPSDVPPGLGAREGRFRASPLPGSAEGSQDGARYGKQHSVGISNLASAKVLLGPDGHGGSTEQHQAEEYLGRGKGLADDDR